MLTALFAPSACCALGVSAKSAIVVEALTGTPLFESNADVRLPMASTTKIMTAVCAIESGMLDKNVEIDPSAVGVEGSSVYLRRGEHMTVRELTYGLMLSSGNDAAVAIACAVSGSVEKFAALMNDTASRIGAKNTHFTNPNGLDDEQHYTTARDLAAIAAYGMKNEEFRKIVSSKTAVISNEGMDYKRRLTNHNRLLKMYSGCIGVKTGFTKRSGRCLVSAAERNGVVLVAVTLNAPDDWNDHRNMLDFGFKTAHAYPIVRAGNYACGVNVTDGSEAVCPLVYGDSFGAVVIDGANLNYTVKYNVPKNIAAPVGYHAAAGTAEIFCNGKKIKSVPLVCKNIIPKDNTKTLSRSIQIVLTDFFGW